MIRVLQLQHFLSHQEQCHEHSIHTWFGLVKASKTCNLSQQSPFWNPAMIQPSWILGKIHGKTVIMLGSIQET
jgi:hypothetical protein